MSSGLNGKNNIGIRCKTLQCENAQMVFARIGKLYVANLNNPQVNCLTNIINSMFVLSDDASGCVVGDLSPAFKNLICQTVNDCPYYCVDCEDPPVRGFANLNTLNNFNSTDDSNSFFHEEIIDDDNLSSQDFSIAETDNVGNADNVKDTNITTYSKFISKNLLTQESLINNNLKIISIDKIETGKWLFNGNICLEIPKSTHVSNIKLFVYLDENVVGSGEIDLGTHLKTKSQMIKSHPFNLIFTNDIKGGELKIGIISFDNVNEIKLLKTSNFFANRM